MARYGGAEASARALGHPRAAPSPLWGKRYGTPPSEVGGDAWSLHPQPPPLPLWLSLPEAKTLGIWGPNHSRLLAQQGEQGQERVRGQQLGRLHRTAGVLTWTSGSTGYPRGEGLFSSTGDPSSPGSRRHAPGMKSGAGSASWTPPTYKSHSSHPQGFCEPVVKYSSY